MIYHLYYYCVMLCQYQIVMESMAGEIDAGVYEGVRLPSEAELGLRFGVSRITVSRAMRELESRGLVRRSRGSGTFAVPAEERGKGKPGLPVVAENRLDLVLPFADWAGSEILEGAALETRSAGFELSLRLTGGKLLEERAALDALIGGGARYVLAFPSQRRGNLDRWAALAASGAQLVFLDRRPLGRREPLIQSDHSGGARFAAEHLLAHGHRRIAFVASDFNEASSVEERFTAYTLALEKAGVALDESLVRELPGREAPALASERRGPEEAEAALTRILDELLSLPSPPTALMAANDEIALRLMRAALARGLVLPRDLSIVGFDDIFMAAHASVPLTTIHQNFRGVGAVGARAVLGISRRGAEGRTVSSGDRILPALLVERESVGERPNLLP